MPLKDTDFYLKFHFLGVDFIAFYKLSLNCVRVTPLDTFFRKDLTLNLHRGNIPTMYYCNSNETNDTIKLCFFLEKTNFFDVCLSLYQNAKKG